MTDGFWKGGDPGYGNYDKNGGAGNTNFDGNASQSNDGGNYADDESDTAADGAMKFYETDLRSDLDNNVPTIKGVNEADHQHLVWYAIPFGIKGTLDPATDDPTDPDFPGWPTPVRGVGTTVDDIWHASYNSRGLFLDAQDPAELIASLEDAVQDIAQRTAVAAAVSASSSRLTTDNTIFVAEFNTNGWSGNLFGYNIADTESGELETDTVWGGDSGVGDILNARNLITNPRTILTYNGTDGIPFQWTDLTTDQKNDLKTNQSGGTDSDTIGASRLDFIRGDRDNEGLGHGFRQRLSRMGDSGHAGPVYVAAPSLGWPDTAPFPIADGSRYSDFKTGVAASREPVVYLAANDGMIHGFRESDGEEVIAYIPNTVYSDGTNEGLHYLADPGYMHIYYNDLTPTLSDIYANLGSGDRWSTVMIGGQRGGGRGIYALDVTDPNSFSEGNAANIVLWEFTSDDDADLNYSFSRPQIALANNGQWVAIFGNGYDENNPTDGDAKLFILDIEKGIDGTWTAGDDYIKIDTGIGSSSNPNGLSPPTLADLDGNGTVDRVYAGDLRGDMHVFDLSSTNPGAWNTHRLFQETKDRPITAAPAIAKHPNIGDDASNYPNVMVYFGTGQYLTDVDKSDTGVERFHGVWDKGDSGLNAGDLVTQTFDGSFSERVVTNNSVNYAGGEYGWQFNLPDSGERSITSAVVRGDLVFFNSYVPNVHPCKSGGYGYAFAVRLDTGGSPDDVSVDINDDQVLDESDQADNGTEKATIAAIKKEGYLPEPVFVEDIKYDAAKPTKVIALDKIPTGRYSWQEVVQ